MSIRLDKLLANLGYASRREIPVLVRAGRVTLGGAPVTDAARKLAPADCAGLRVDGEALDPLPGVVVVLNKPLGMTCSHKEEGPLVYDLLPERWRRRDPPISTVGRLDKDTTGLLLLTDNGALLHKIIAPKTHLPKRYVANLAEPLRGGEAEVFASGTLMLRGEAEPLRPGLLEVLAPTRAALTITEGRYHQVRRMFAAVDNRVVALHRDRIGGLMLPDDLAPGHYRVLDAGAIAGILAAG